MGYKEHIKDETRTTEDFLKIKLHKEGNFWRAYEWSAYLSRLFPSDLNEIDRLKPLKKSFSNISLESFLKGIATYPIENKTLINSLEFLSSIKNQSIKFLKGELLNS